MPQSDIFEQALPVKLIYEKSILNVIYKSDSKMKDVLVREAKLTGEASKNNSAEAHSLSRTGFKP
jgi:hypothetical protein